MKPDSRLSDWQYIREQIKAFGRGYACLLAMTASSIHHAGCEQALDEKRVVKLIRADNHDTSTTKSSITLSDSTVDMGIVPPNSTARASVVVSNSSLNPLRITSRSSCGCTVTEVPAHPLTPGESVELELRLSTVGRSESSLTRVVTFIPDDGSSSISLEIRAEIRELIQINPRAVHEFPNGFADVSLSAADGRAFRIVSVVPPILESPVIDRQSDRHMLRVSEALWQEHGSSNVLSVTTDHELASQLTVPIGTEMSDCNHARHQTRVVPRRLDFGNVEANQVVVRRLLLRDVAFKEDIEIDVDLIGNEQLVARIENVAAHPHGILLTVEVALKGNMEGRSEFAIQVNAGKAYGVVAGTVRSRAIDVATIEMNN